MVACVASVPVREPNEVSGREKDFPIREAQKMGREQKGRGRGVGEGKEGNYELVVFCEHKNYIHGLKIVRCLPVLRIQPLSKYRQGFLLVHLFVMMV